MTTPTLTLHDLRRWAGRLAVARSETLHVLQRVRLLEVQEQDHLLEGLRLVVEMVERVAAEIEVRRDGCNTSTGEPIS